ncbi:MAG TPA: hypothetical protein VGK18_00995 [Propionicimonas sp.]|uniref:hypothetical protein n=1 Tax=Propionicimonas sp. TaxID=1955623 RepID=UPI002F415657
MTATTPDHRPLLRERLLNRLDEVGDALHLPVTGRRVPGTIAVAVLAALASLGASVYFVGNHQLSLGYADALAHLTAARQLFDAPAGFSVPPLPTVLLTPFMVSVWLWSSGWGAALLGACCLAATAAAVYRIGARWGLHGLGRLTGVAAVVANPTMLYLHSTALSRPVLIAGMAGCLAGIAHWAATDRLLRPRELALYAGVPGAVAALSGYEGWALVGVGTAYVAIITWHSTRDLRTICREVAGFVAVPVLAVVAWSSASLAAVGDPLAYMAELSTTTPGGPPGLDLGSMGQVALSLTTMNIAVVNTVGFGLVGLAAAGLCVLLPWNRVPRLPGFLALALSTYAYLAVTLILGRVVVLNPANSVEVWNNRHGMPMIIAAALFAAAGVDLAARTLSSRHPRFVAGTQVIVAVVTAGALVAQTLWLAPAPDRRSLVLLEAVTQLSDSAGPRRVAEWLGQNYDGGRIIIDEALPSNNILPLAGLPLREYYLSSSPVTFAAALADPVGHVRWVWATEDPDDRVGRSIAADPAFHSRYRVVYSESGVRLYQRR